MDRGWIGREEEGVGSGDGKSYPIFFFFFFSSLSSSLTVVLSSPLSPLRYFLSFSWTSSCRTPPFPRWDALEFLVPLVDDHHPERRQSMDHGTPGRDLNRDSCRVASLTGWSSEGNRVGSHLLVKGLP